MTDRIRKTEPMTAGARHAIAALLLIVAMVSAANLLFTARDVNSVRTELTAQCQFDSDLGAAPVSINPATGKASVLSVTIIADARAAWRGMRCPGLPGAPDPSFVKWTRYFRDHPG